MSENVFIKEGYQYVSAKINEAVENGSRCARISGNYEISRAVRLPSFFTLILEDAHLRMADGVYDNMFVNEHHGTPEGNTVDGTDRAISIIGRGRVVLDGGKYNGLSERTQHKNGLPPIYKNNLVLFTNVDGFRISGISCHNQRWWALNFIYCRGGYIGNIDFKACDIGFAPDGTEYHGLIREKYGEILVKNADGIDLRQGCHDIVIENVSGFTEDDTVALTGLNGIMEQEFKVEGLCPDICNVKIRNVRSSAFCTIVRLLNQSGVRLHDIDIDGVYDTAQDCPHLDHGLYTVRVGDTHLYGTRHSTEDETYNIAIKNVRGCGDYVLSLAGSMNGLTLYGLESFGGAKMLLDERVK